MRLSTLSIITIITLTASNAWAVGKIESPNVEKGEFEASYSGSSEFDHKNNRKSKHSHELELEYGLTDRIGLELALEMEKEKGHALKTSHAEIGTRFQFFEQGENWMDSGIMLSYVRSASRAEADAIEAKLLLEKQTGKLLHRLNLGLEQQVGPHSNSAPERELAFSSRYRYSKYFEPGLEIHSEFGKANEHKNFNEQEHFVGPSAYGQLMPHINYEAAYLVGVTKGAPDSAVRAVIQYEMAF